MSYGMSSRGIPCKLLFVVLLFIYIPFRVNAQQPGTSALDKRVTIQSKKKCTMGKIISLIDDAGKVVISTDESIPNGTYRVNFKDKTIREILQMLFKNGEYTWESTNQTDIILRKTNSGGLNKPNKEAASTPKKPITEDTLIVTGTVTDKDCIPLPGASIMIKGTKQGGTADANGDFSISHVKAGADIRVSIVGYITSERKMGASNDFVLSADTSTLQETVVRAYGLTTRRNNTSSMGIVKTADIYPPPNANPLGVLAGRVTGILVIQTNGNAGAPFILQIRGKNSIAQGSDPLCLIDGVPFPNTTVGTGGFVMGNGGQSLFANLNYENIESIEVLKDADATAIYGSRGANGVILITTKKGKPGDTKYNVSVNRGIGTVTRKLKLLNTAQYLTMRREAFKNDGIKELTVSNAPDLVAWDTTKNTDWQDSLIGRAANYTNANAALYGGSLYTQGYVSANYNKQTTVYPDEQGDQRGVFYMNVKHNSVNQKFGAIISSSYSMDKNTLSSDLTPYTNMAPNTPGLIDNGGRLVWSKGGGTFNNPLAFLLAKNRTTTDNFIGSINLHYELFKWVTLKTTGGYNYIQVNELYTNPKAAQDPNANNVVSSAKYGNSTSKTWIIEPQIEFRKNWGDFDFTILMGSTLEKDSKTSTFISASDFANDALLESAAAAKNIDPSTTYTEYRYQAVFTRISVSFLNKYLLNITGRRDGSSRFGPDKQAANFGAIGAAWIISDEAFFKKAFPFLSFGKLRSSYGVTGNDQIGDYLYLNNYVLVNGNLQGQSGYRQDRITNPDYHWERNIKYEAAVELGALEDRVFLAINRYRNKSDNQLIEYKLPDQSGYPSVFRNFGATVQNTGWEFELSATIIRQEDFQWTVAGNLTIASNKLLSFPGLETSSYANQLVLGQPLNIQKLLHYKDVDSISGIYQFAGTNIPDDQTSVGNLTPKFYGGVSSTFRFRNFGSDILIQFIKQNGLSYATAFGANAPGTRSNQPVEVLNRWKEKGDQTTIQKFTTMGPAINAYNNYALYSNGKLSDASFIRLKNINIWYALPKSLLRTAKVDDFRIYLQANNLLTITKYKGLDPESGSNNLPVLRVITVGIQIKL
jgi:TonB-linked SusC/RagA family outer membrane protein